MSGSNQKGYTFTYTYKTPGTYNMVIVATRHGHSSPDYQNVIINRALVVEQTSDQMFRSPSCKTTKKNACKFLVVF
jgi:hypothetical protein